jgi:general nucleoside transport system permease protein
MALSLSFAIISVILIMLSADPIQVFDSLITGALSTKFFLGQTIMIATVLSLTGLAAAVPFSAFQWNVGGEGQMYFGAFAAASLALSLPPDWPHWILAPLIVAGAAAAGAFWGFVPGFLKATIRANEVITCLMLNFIAVLFADYAITVLWPNPASRGTADVPLNSTLPNIWSGTVVTAGAPIAVGAVLVAWLIMSRTRLGFEIRASGLNARAARLNGIRVERVIAASFTLGGMFAGLAGAVAVLGMYGALVSGFSGNFGFLGIAVALVARLRPLFIIPSAFVFATLRVGSNGLQVSTGLSPTVGEMIVALLIVLLLAFRVIRMQYAEAAS